MPYISCCCHLPLATCHLLPAKRSRSGGVRQGRCHGMLSSMMKCLALDARRPSSSHRVPSGSRHLLPTRSPNDVGAAQCSPPSISSIHGAWVIGRGRLKTCQAPQWRRQRRRVLFVPPESVYSQTSPLLPVTTPPSSEALDIKTQTRSGVLLLSPGWSYADASLSLANPAYPRSPSTQVWEGGWICGLKRSQTGKKSVRK